MMSTTDNASEQESLLARIDALARVHRVRYRGAELVWRQFGQGSPLVLIHGGHGSWMHWIRNIEALGSQHTVWLPDLPGFGESDTLEGESDADQLAGMVDALVAGIEALLRPAGTFGLAGFSFGGLVAARLAAGSRRVGRLALLGSAGHGGPRRQAVELINWRTEDRRQKLDALRHNLGAMMLHDPARIDGLAMTVHERMCSATRFRSKKLSRNAVLGDVLSAFQAPTLLLWGEHDVTAVPVDVAQKIAGQESNRDWCIVPGAGHWVQYERPHDVNQLLLRWFS